MANLSMVSQVSSKDVCRRVQLERPDELLVGGRYLEIVDELVEGSDSF